MNGSIRVEPTMRPWGHARIPFPALGIASALVGLLLVSAPARAEGAPEGASEGNAEVDYTEMTLEQLIAIPVFTASKHEQSSAEAPSWVTVINAAEIGAYGWRTLGEILASAPGFYVTSPHTYGFVGVRGFGRPGDFGGRILLLLNGHRMNDPLYDTAAVVNDFALDTDLIDHLEIVRGPGSALYGNNAFFAVINVVTRKTGQVSGLEVAGEAGTFRAYRERFTYGLRSQGGTDALVSVSRYDSDGNPRIYFPQYDDPKTGDGIVRGADGESAFNAYGSVRRGPLALEGVYVGRHREEPAPGYGTVFGTPRKTFDQRAFLEGRCVMSPAEQLELTTRLYYDRYHYRGDYPYDGAEMGVSQEIVLNRDLSTSESVGGEAQLSWRMSRRLTTIVGGEVRHDYREQLKNFDVSPKTDYLDINPTTHNEALYLQEEYRPWAGLLVTAGSRFDHYDTFGHTVNPRLACVYNAAGGTSVKLLYGQAFRAPNANEFFYEDSGISAKVNPDLKPERIRTYEVVCEQRLGSRTHASVAGFHNRVTNLIDQAQDPEDDLYYAANLGEVDASGAEFELERQVGVRTRARASYTFARAKDEATGAELTNSPEHLGKVNVTGPVLRGWLFAGGEVQYVSRRKTIVGTTLGAVTLCNVDLRSSRWRDRYEISLAIYNLFDTRYQDPDAAMEAVPRDGRTFRLKIGARS